jgi:D-alanine-D-alanine ligase
MRIAVAWNDDLAFKPHLNDIERIGEAEVADVAREIAEVLGAELVPVGDDLLGALNRLRSFDVVVNLCEGVLGNPGWEMHFALALEMLGIPFTGCDPTATALCSDKTLVNKLLAAAGVSTPRRGDAARFPLIVKPALQDAGVGIDAASVVSTPEERDARVRWVRETYGQPAVVEEFIDGPELNQAFFLGRPLPPGEVVFAEDLSPAERVVGWKAKWDAGSREDLGTQNRTPARIDDATREALADLCARAADVLGLGTGYCRFDVRQDRDGQLYIVDVNPHPDLGRDAGFRKALAAAGIGFREFLDALIMSATDENPSRRSQGS